MADPTTTTTLLGANPSATSTTTSTIPVTLTDEQQNLANRAANKTGAQINSSEGQQTIRIWDRNNPYSSGAIPNWFPLTVTGLNNIDAYISQMSWSEIVTLKRALSAGGFYMKQAIATAEANAAAAGRTLTSDQRAAIALSVQTLDGKWNENDQAALKDLIGQFTLSNSGSLDQFIVSSIAKNSATKQANINSLLSMDVLSETIQSNAMKTINRNLSDEEVSQILTQTFNPREKTNTVDNQRIILGGNLNSEAIQYGKELANAYGLVASPLFDPNSTADFGVEMSAAVKGGRAITLRGNTQSLQKFYDWAQTNMGEGQIFADVQMIGDGNEDDPSGAMSGLRIALREGVAIPDSGTYGNFMYGGRNQMNRNDSDKFLMAVRSPYGIESYGWETPEPGRHGAYALTEGTWNHYAGIMGYDVSDHSADTQDRVANAYIADLNERYKGDWQLIAIAFAGNIELADDIRARQQMSPNSTIDYFGGEFSNLAEVKTARKLLERMGGMGSESNFSMSGYDRLFNVIDSTNDVAGLDLSNPDAVAARNQRIFRDAYRYEIAGAKMFDAMSADLKQNVYARNYELLQQRSGGQ